MKDKCFNLKQTFTKILNLEVIKINFCTLIGSSLLYERKKNRTNNLCRKLIEFFVRKGILDLAANPPEPLFAIYYSLYLPGVPLKDQCYS